MKNNLWPLTPPRQIAKHLQSLGKDQLPNFVHPWDVLDAIDTVLRKLTLSIDTTLLQKQPSIIEGQVIIGPHVRIFEGAKIVGPAIIGEGTIIGNGALVRDSVISDHCVIGYCTEIARSYIGPECWFHTNYVGDSVFERNISMGSGAITANLRLDEAEIKSKSGSELVGSKRNKFGTIVGMGVRFGINTGIMPGIKIGRDSFIASGIMLNQDLPDKSFVVLRQKLEIKKNRTSVSIQSRESFHKKL